MHLNLDGIFLRAAKHFFMCTFTLAMQYTKDSNQRARNSAQFRSKNPSCMSCTTSTKTALVIALLDNPIFEFGLYEPLHITASARVIVKAVDIRRNLWNCGVDIIFQCVTNSSCYFHDVSHQVDIAQGLHMGTSSWTAPAML